jgi:para-nitrobenzyl esterase
MTTRKRHPRRAAAARAAAVANEYPLGAYPSAAAAFSLLVSDASFACPALQVDRWTTAHHCSFRAAG